LQKTKKQFIIFGVIMMRAQKELLRLQSEDKIGNRHIAVKRHVPLKYPLHWHDYFEIEIIVAGTDGYILNGAAYPIRRGDVFLLTPVDFHEIEATSQIELINISFDEVWLSEDLRTLLYTADYAKRTRFEGDDYDRLVTVAELLRYECESDTPCVHQLLEYLLRRFVLRDAKQYDSAANPAHLTGIKKAVAYIELHFREQITLQRLSAISGYNPTYFSELFRKFTGETYMERLTSLRVNYAKALLARGLSVSDACFESGFGSLSNFLAVFKAKCGMPPSEYKRKRRNGIAERDFPNTQ